MNIDEGMNGGWNEWMKQLLDLADLSKEMTQMVTWTNVWEEFPPPSQPQPSFYSIAQAVSLKTLKGRRQNVSRVQML